MIKKLSSIFLLFLFVLIPQVSAEETSNIIYETDPSVLNEQRELSSEQVKSQAANSNYFNAYQNMIDKYKTAINENWDYQTCKSNNVSRLINLKVGNVSAEIDKLGYFLYDVNKDGTPELFIGNISNKNLAPQSILGAYTMNGSNCVPLYVLSGQEEALLLTTTDLFAYQTPEVFYWMNQVGTSLEFIEGIYEKYDSFSSTLKYYYSNNPQKLDQTEITKEKWQEYYDSQPIKKLNFETFSSFNNSSPNIPVESIEFSQSTYNLKVQENIKLIPIFKPSNATNTLVSWKSDNPLVASVNQSGNITANSEGTATITITAIENGCTGKCQIIVKNNNSTGYEFKLDGEDSDAWRFTNYGDYTKNWKNSMLSQDLDHLDKITNSVEWTRLREQSHEGGHCYGMTTSAVLKKLGLLNDNRIDSRSLHHTEDSNGVESLLCYFQALTCLNTYQDLRKSYSSDYEIAYEAGDEVYNNEELKIWKASADHIRTISELAQSVNKVKNSGCPVVITIGSVTKENKSFCHAIVGYALETGKTFKSYSSNKTYDSKIYIYDPNSGDGVKKPYYYDDDYNLLFNSSNYEWEIPAYNDNRQVSSAKTGRILGIQDSINEIYPSDNVGIASVSNNSTSVLSLDQNINEVKVTNKNSGEYWILRPSQNQILGKTPLKQILYPTDTGEQSEFNIILPTTPLGYTIESNSGLDFSFDNNNSYISLDSKGIKKADIGLDDSISINNSEKSNFNITLANNKINENSFSIFTLTGSNDSIKAVCNNNGLNIEGSNLKSLNILGDNKTTTSSITITEDRNNVNVETSKNQLTIDNNNSVNDSNPHIQYQSHIENLGWVDYVKDGAPAGTEGQGLRQEALRIQVVDSNGNPYSGLGVTYRSHVQDEGWQNYVSDNAVSGTTGKARKVEAVQLKLTGSKASQYDLWYQTHIEDYGWTNWAKNGEACGSEGFNKRMESIRIQILPKNSSAPSGSGLKLYSSYGPGLIRYCPHVESVGWQNYVSDFQEAGTTGRNLKLEALIIAPSPELPQGDIQASAHIQDVGWTDYLPSYNLIGTTGQNKRLEAIKLRLTGDLAKEYDIVYQSHVQDEGWQNEVMNDSVSGTTGKSRKIEAIRIKLVKKGSYQPTPEEPTIVPVTGITLNQKSLTLDPGETFNLTYKITPDNATNKDVTWKSDNESVASVSSSGLVTAKGAGSTTITVTTKDGGYKASCSVTVKSKIVSVESIKLNMTSAELKPGETLSLRATIYPENATNQNVSWSSSKPDTVSVSNYGTIKALKTGSATITVTTEDGHKSASCLVRVVENSVPVKSISLSPTSLNLKIGESAKITATVSPDNATDKNINWSSKNSSIASVSGGQVTARGKGSTDIVATSADGKVSASCRVTVSEEEKDDETRVTGVDIRESYVGKNTGTTVQLTLAIAPSTATNKKVTWSSSDDDKASVDSTGLVILKKPGEVTITVITDDGHYMDTCTIAIFQAVTKVEFDHYTLDLKVGETGQINATVYPEDCDDKRLYWLSRNEDVATVDDNGKVTAVSPGEAEIVAISLRSQNIKPVCKVTVTK